jgi:hypothetical protein
LREAAKKKTRFIQDDRAKQPPWMRVPIELEHLIRTSCEPQPPHTPLRICLNAAEARKALEVENYLRACALRLEQTDKAGQYTGVRQ